MLFLRRTYRRTTERVMICSKDDLRSLRCPYGCSVFIVPQPLKSRTGPCMHCLLRVGRVRVGKGQRIGDKLPSERIPPFHPNCKCKVELKFKGPGGKAYNYTITIDTLRRWRKGVRDCIVMRVPRTLEEPKITAGVKPL